MKWAGEHEDLVWIGLLLVVCGVLYVGLRWAMQRLLAGAFWVG